MSSININYEGKTESHEMEALPKQPEGGGGGCEIIELTQKEYDDLPDTKLTDGKLYKIKDVNINGDATTVTYVDPEGNKTNVADEFDKVNNNLSELNSNLNVKSYEVETSILDSPLPMFRYGNIAFLNVSFQTNKDISWGDVIVSSLPSELCTNGYFFGSIIGNGVVEINKNQIQFKPTATIHSSDWLIAILVYPII